MYDKNNVFAKINQLLTKLAPFKTEDDKLNSLLKERNNITDKLLAKKSDLVNEDDPKKQFNILKDI